MKRCVKDRYRTKVALRDGYRCRYCGDTRPPFELEHVIPLSKGGNNHLTNFVFSCSECNRKKDDLLPYEITDEMLRDKVIDVLSDIRYNTKGR